MYNNKLIGYENYFNTDRKRFIGYKRKLEGIVDDQEDLQVRDIDGTPKIKRSNEKTDHIIPR